MNKRILAVQYFVCLVLVATFAIEFIYNAFYFTHHFYSLATHPRVRFVGLLRCPLSLPGAPFLGFALFWLRRYGVGLPWEISIGIRDVWTIFVKICRLAKFRRFLLFGCQLLCLPHPVLHNSL